MDVSNCSARSRVDEQFDTYGEIVRSWHPDADAERNAQALSRHGGQKARCTEETTYKPFQPSRGECRDVSAEPVVTAACIFSAGGPWVRPAPGIPCALCLKRADEFAKLGRDKRRENEPVCLNTVIASEAKQSRVVGGTLDCFVASLLAMTNPTDVTLLRDDRIPISRVVIPNECVFAACEMIAATRPAMSPMETQ